MSGIGQYFRNVLIGLDQLGNALWGGDPDETISSRLGKMRARYGGRLPWYRPLPSLVAWWLERVDPGHCEGAIEPDEGCDAVVDRIREHCGE